MEREANNWLQTRESLLARLKNLEDRESWEEFFNTYWKLIYKVALKSGLSNAEAEEAVQETFIRIAKSIQEFRYDPKLGSFKGWLMKTAHWKIKDQHRRKYRQRKQVTGGRRPEARTATDDQIPDPNGFDLIRHWDDMWEENLLEAAVERVKNQVHPKSFQMFEFTVNRDWPVKQVAAEMKVSIARVYYAKHKVASLIRTELKQLKKQEDVRDWKKK